MKSSDLKMSSDAARFASCKLNPSLRAKPDQEPSEQNRNYFLSGKFPICVSDTIFFAKYGLEKGE